MHQCDNDRSEEQQTDLAVQYLAQLSFAQSQLGNGLELLFIFIQVTV